MKNTSVDEFRKQLKSWMDSARSEPLKITRRSGESFVMIGSAEYEEMQRQLTQMKGQYQGLLDAFQGRTQDYSEQTISDLFESVKTKARKTTKTKAIG